MTDHKKEWYLKRNVELTKALLKIDRMCKKSKYYSDGLVYSFIATRAILEITTKLNLESEFVVK